MNMEKQVTQGIKRAVLLGGFVLVTVGADLNMAAGTPTTPPSVQSVLRVGCDNCPSSLLVMVDGACTLQVDGQDLGGVAESGTKLVRVDIGEHLIAAKAGDVRWETVVKVEKPGQVVVKTDFGKARADQVLKSVAAKWEGKWFGELYYGPRPVFSKAATGRYHGSGYYETFTFKVSKDGSCYATHESGYAVDSAPEDERASDFRDRLLNEAKRNSGYRGGYSCTLTPEGTIDSVFGSVTGNGSFSFKKTHDDYGQVTISLRKQ